MSTNVRISPKLQASCTHSIDGMRPSFNLCVVLQECCKDWRIRCLTVRGSTEARALNITCCKADQQFFRRILALYTFPKAPGRAASRCQPDSEPESHIHINDNEVVTSCAFPRDSLPGGGTQCKRRLQNTSCTGRIGR